MEELEELINDPGNHALLKEAAGQKEMKREEVAKKAGLSKERTKDKLDELHDKELIELDKSEKPVSLKLQRENLQKLSEEIKGFQEDRRQVLVENLEEDQKLLEDAKKELEKNIEETSVVKKERKFERRLDSIKNTFKIIQEANTDDELFEAHAYAHRVLKLTGERENDFQRFNPFRKLKAARKIQEILGNKPEKEEPRRFFGNRWVKKSRLGE